MTSRCTKEKPILSPKTLQRFSHPLPGRYRHALDPQCTLNLIVAHHVVLGKLLQPDFVKRKMQHTTHPGSSIHQRLRELPDRRLFPDRLTDQPNQFICRERIIVPHMIDTTLNALLYNQLLHHKADVINRAKRPPVLIRPQWPGNTFAYHMVEQVQVSLVSRSVYHARTKDKHIFLKIIRFVSFCQQVLFRFDLRFPIGANRSRLDILRQHIPRHTVRRCLHRAEEDKCPRFRLQEIVEYLLRKPSINIKITLRHTLVLCVVRFPGKVNNRVHRRDLPKFLPTKNVLHTLLLRLMDIQTNYRMVLEPAIGKIGTYETVYASDKNSFHKISENQ